MGILCENSKKFDHWSLLMTLTICLTFKNSINELIIGQFSSFNKIFHKPLTLINETTVKKKIINIYKFTSIYQYQYYLWQLLNLYIFDYQL